MVIVFMKGKERLFFLAVQIMPGISRTVYIMLHTRSLIEKVL